MSYIGDDGYDYERRPRYDRLRTDRYLNPTYDYGGLSRTRSQGASPNPVVNVYNEPSRRGSNSRSPPYPPSPRGGRRASGRDFLGSDLAEDFADLALENRRLRSRSRGRSDATSRRDDYYDWERERELSEMRRRDQKARDEERYETKRIKDEAKRKADEQAAKDDKKRIIDEYEKKHREEEEERKAEEKRIREKVEQEKREAKEKEEKEWAAFLLKQKEKEEKEKKEKKEAEEKFEEEMRKRLARFGFPPAQIDMMVKEEKAKAGFPPAPGSAAVDVWRPRGAPVFAKVHRDYLSIDTLKYYDIPWEYDHVSHFAFAV